MKNRQQFSVTLSDETVKYLKSKFFRLNFSASIDAAVKELIKNETKPKTECLKGGDNCE